ncbi:MAG: hypothetical protein NZ869_04175 [Thermoanaerobaculum sp.]|nr:hypothetical protein [Thermoanaerobaculum sp.]MCX7895673.1 hypothetical protein [Thermoanaerobaculum sp.]MDW7968455.1 c-type cytochrome domain-containing protein [Thermoanaerobaculum sp.]
MRVGVLVFVAVVATAVATSQTPRSYQQEVEPIFIKECVECHGSERPKKGLDLSAGRGYAQLVNRKSVEVPELYLVAPGDPANSYLWHKLEHTAKEGKGMPRGLFSSRKLKEAELAIIRQWIEQGAQP